MLYVPEEKDRKLEPSEIADQILQNNDDTAAEIRKIINRPDYEPKNWFLTELD